MKSSRDPLPSPNPATSKATATPSTSLSANASGAPGYLILLAPSHSNLNLFPKGKNNRYAFVPDGFESVPAPTDELNSALHCPWPLELRLLKAFTFLKQNCPEHQHIGVVGKDEGRGPASPPIEMSPMTKMEQKSLLFVSHILYHTFIQYVISHSDVPLNYK